MLLPELVHSGSSSSGGSVSDGASNDADRSMPLATETEPAAPAAAPAAPAAVAASWTRRQRAEGSNDRGAKKENYTAVLHCGSVRQLARVLQMQEAVHDGGDGSSGLSSSIQAAAALLRHGDDAHTGRGGAADGAGGGDSPRCHDLGSVVQVTFRFVHRPEWLRHGSRLVVRDRSDGHVAAVGFINALD